MLENAFAHSTSRPSPKALAQALGKAKPLWDDLVSRAASELDVSGQEWKSYSAKHGWTLRLKQKNRTIVYLSPSFGSFMTSFILGERAMTLARACRFPKNVLKSLHAAIRYPEGTGLRLQVSTKSDVNSVLKLMAIKREN